LYGTEIGANSFPQMSVMHIININELFDIILDFIGTLLTESSLFGYLIKYIADDGKVLQPPDVVRKQLAQK